MRKRGFLLGKFMPPHAGHMALIRGARALVDELTVLVCWLPDDTIAGETRLAWMRELAPDCRIVGHGDVVPQTPEESPDFWPIWRGIVAAARVGVSRAHRWMAGVQRACDGGFELGGGQADEPRSE